MTIPAMQEITEKWLGEIAGWKAMKHGRDLWKSGAVVKASWDGKLLSGGMRDGRKVASAGMRVNGPTDVKNLCSCYESRSTGAVCGHTVAVGLQWIADQWESPESEVSESREKLESKELSAQAAPSAGEWAVAVDLPEGWLLKGAAGKASLRVVRGDLAEGAVPLDEMVLNRWLGDLGVSARAAMISVPVADLLQLITGLRAVDGSLETHGKASLVTVSGSDLDFTGIAYRPKLSGAVTKPDEYDPCTWEMRLGMNAADDSLVMTADSSTWVFSHNQREGNRHWSAVPLIEIEGDWSEMEKGQLLTWRAAALRGEGLEFTPSYEWVLERSDDLQELFDLTEVENVIAREMKIIDRRPIPVLEVEGSMRHLEGTLDFEYSAAVKKLHVNDVKTDTARKSMESKLGFWVKSADGGVVLYRRQREFERAILAELAACGWIEKGQGLLSINQQDAIFQFIAEKVSLWRGRGWRVVFGERFTHVTNNVPVLRPRLVWSGKREAGAGGWMAAQVGYSANHRGKEISLTTAEVENLLRSGRQRFKASSGEEVAVDLAAIRELRETLLDVDPHQTAAGRYEVAAEQGDFLGSALEGSVAPSIDVDVDLSPIAGLVEFLRDYQKAGVRWMVAQARAGRGILLGDDMGLGKTLQTLAFVDWWLRSGNNPGPVLVVVPTSLLGNWQQEAAKWLPDRRVLTLHGTGRKKFFTTIDVAEIVLTTYGLIHRDMDAIYGKTNFSAVVLDEASLLRNPRSQASKAVRRLNAGARVALSGTPVENSVRDLWSIFEFIQPGYLGGFKTFQDRYEKPLSGSSPDVEVGARLSRRVAPYFLRRTKSQVAPELPEKMLQIAQVDLTAAQASLYRKLADTARAKVADLSKQSSGAGRMAALTALLRLRQTCCDVRLLGLEPAVVEKMAATDFSAKRELLKEILRESIEGGHRVLVFSQFVSMLKLIADDLREEGWEFCYLDGQSSNRREEVAKFQKGKTPVFLISLKAGGYGLTLTAADTVVHFDPWWNPAVENQATDRAHRIGQDRPVTVYKLITRGTVEEKVLRLQRKKQTVIDLAVDDRVPMMGGLADVDLNELVK